MAPLPQEFLTGTTGSVHGTSLYRVDEVKPATYCEFAMQDLAEPDSPRTRINAISNAKRAFHLQIELLTDALGFDRSNHRRPGAFPARVDFAALCGVVTPRIMSKLNKLRNEVEHEYVQPLRDTADDFVDVVALYVDASDKYVRSFPVIRELYVGNWRDSNRYCICTTKASGIIRLYHCDMTEFASALPRPIDNRAHPDADALLPIDLTAERAIDITENQATFFDWARLLLHGPTRR